ncbi:MAG: hypothetical protein PHS41_04005 [Victivallaceae bacterium]|nr:hypothetical protein [Victivallaceae bacterium]
MKTKFMLLCAAAILTGTTILCGADLPSVPPDAPSSEAKNQARRNNRNGNRRNADRPTPRRDERAEAESNLKAKFPKEFSEIEKERMATLEKLRSLATKANIKLPLTRDEAIAVIQAKYPEEYAKFEKLRSENPREGWQMLMELAKKADITLNMAPRNPREGGRSMHNTPDFAPEKERGPRENPTRMLRELRTRYPEDFAKIQKLRRTNPEQAKTEMNQLMERLREEKKSQEKN